MSSSRTIDKLVAADFIRAQTLPGPLTLRMIERVVSSINSTRTCVTPPREPFFLIISLPYTKKIRYCARLRTGSAEDSGHLDELDGDFGGGIHWCDRSD